MAPLPAPPKPPPRHRHPPFSFNCIGINNSTERLLRIERRIELGSRFLEGGGPRAQRCYEHLPGSFRWFGRLCYSTVQPQDQPRCTVTFAGRPAIIESRFTEVGLREPDGPPQLRRGAARSGPPQMRRRRPGVGRFELALPNAALPDEGQMIWEPDPNGNEEDLALCLRIAGCCTQGGGAPQYAGFGDAPKERKEEEEEAIQEEYSASATTPPVLTHHPNSHFRLIFPPS